MQIIPVIDLLDGAIVHAKKGERQHYQPIKSLLTSSHKPLDIVSALFDIYSFKQLYIADLNAIQKIENVYATNFSIIEAIAKRFPHLKLWIDAGVSNNTELIIWQKLDATIVLGTENFARLSNFLSLKNQLNSQFVLSLDFMPHGYQGPAELLTNTEHWPQDVIVMSLANVGANQGMNIDLIKKMIAIAVGKNIYAAGGIRHAEDLNILKKMGVHGALIATTLHQQQLSAGEIKSLS
jgi:phosphoribosylformimino-5-aminoimidazole carboxamide ribotide isomerase